MEIEVVATITKKLRAFEEEVKELHDNYARSDESKVERLHDRLSKFLKENVSSKEAKRSYDSLPNSGVMDSNESYNKRRLQCLRSFLSGLIESIEKHPGEIIELKAQPEVQEPSEQIMAELLKTFLATGIFPDNARFRLDHKPHRELIEELINENLLRVSSERLELRLGGLLTLNTKEKVDLVQKCDKLLPVLHKAYEKHLNKGITVEQIANETGQPAQEISCCLYFITELSVWSNLNGQPPQGITLKEEIIDLHSLEAGYSEMEKAKAHSYRSIDDVLSTLSPPTPQSPLFPILRHSVNEEWQRLKKDQIEPWIFMPHARPFSVKNFYDKNIQYQGIEFAGSPREVFWGGYIEPFLKNIISTQIEKTVELANKKRLLAGSPLDEVSVLLRNLVRDAYRLMSGIDQRLSGKGFPSSAPLRKVDSLIKMMEAFIIERVEAEKKMTPNPKKEWTRGERLTVYGFAITVFLTATGWLINYVVTSNRPSPSSVATIQQNTAGPNSPIVNAQTVNLYNQTPIKKSSNQTATADLHLRLEGNEAPIVQVSNNSAATAHDIYIAYALWNMEHPEIADPIKIPFSQMKWLKPKQSSGRTLLLSEQISQSIKRGDRILGSISIDCSDCERGRTYLVYIEYGKGGWIAEDKNEKSGSLRFPVKDNRPDATTLEARNRYFDFIKSIPDSIRVPISD